MLSESKFGSKRRRIVFHVIYSYYFEPFWWPLLVDLEQDFDLLLVVETHPDLLTQSDKNRILARQSECGFEVWWVDWFPMLTASSLRTSSARKTLRSSIDLMSRRFSGADILLCMNSALTGSRVIAETIANAGGKVVVVRPVAPEVRAQRFADCAGRPKSLVKFLISQLLLNWRELAEQIALNLFLKKRSETLLRVFRKSIQILFSYVDIEVTDILLESTHVGMSVAEEIFSKKKFLVALPSTECSLPKPGTLLILPPSPEEDYSSTYVESFWRFVTSILESKNFGDIRVRRHPRVGAFRTRNRQTEFFDANLRDFSSLSLAESLRGVELVVGAGDSSALFAAKTIAPRARVLSVPFFENQGRFQSALSVIDEGIDEVERAENGSLRLPEKWNSGAVLPAGTLTVADAFRLMA